jgi:aspartate kinase
MGIIVQKFGGTSVASYEARAAAIEHIETALAQGYQVVVVVSAMGRKGDPYATDTLLSLIPDTQTTTKRDLDILMSCGEAISAVVFASQLRAKGHEVTVMTGGHAGIVTNDQFGNARILDIHPQRILSELNAGKIVVVMGFQGVSESGDITTLGRGGSDTTATALGVALSAEYVDIFTDVEGIMTADPRIVDDAKRLDRVTYTEICNLAYQGAKVIHPRAVEIAMQRNIPIRVRSTMSKDEGTLVTTSLSLMEGSKVTDRFVTGVAQATDFTQIKLSGKEVEARTVFTALAEHGISLDFISVTPDRIAFTVNGRDAKRAEDLLKRLGLDPELVPNCARVAAVGAGMAGVPGVMARIVDALTREGIEILQSADSHTTIWCLVREVDMERAVRALHREFGLSDI